MLARLPGRLIASAECSGYHPETSRLVLGRWIFGSWVATKKRCTGEKLGTWLNSLVKSMVKSMVKSHIINQLNHENNGLFHSIRVAYNIISAILLPLGVVICCHVIPCATWLAGWSFPPRTSWWVRKGHVSTSICGVSLDSKETYHLVGTEIMALSMENLENLGKIRWMLGISWEKYPSGGWWLEHEWIMTFQKQLGMENHCHHPNCYSLTPSFFRGVGQPPTINQWQSWSDPLLTWHLVKFMAHSPRRPTPSNISELPRPNEWLTRPSVVQAPFRNNSGFLQHNRNSIIFGRAADFIVDCCFRSDSPMFYLLLIKRLAWQTMPNEPWCFCFILTWPRHRKQIYPMNQTFTPPKMT